jgi:hypothetical protein
MNKIEKFYHYCSVNKNSGKFIKRKDLLSEDEMGNSITVGFEWRYNNINYSYFPNYNNNCLSVEITKSGKYICTISADVKDGENIMQKFMILTPENKVHLDVDPIAMVNNENIPIEFGWVEALYASSIDSNMIRYTYKIIGTSDYMLVDLDAETGEVKNTMPMQW